MFYGIATIALSLISLVCLLGGLHLEGIIALVGAFLVAVLTDILNAMKGRS